MIDLIIFLGIMFIIFIVPSLIGMYISGKNKQWGWFSVCLCFGLIGSAAYIIFGVKKAKGGR
jgi:Na+/melibiose symporter-like transporter